MVGKGFGGTIAFRHGSTCLRSGGREVSLTEKGFLRIETEVPSLEETSVRAEPKVHWRELCERAVVERDPDRFMSTIQDYLRYWRETTSIATDPVVQETANLSQVQAPKRLVGWHATGESVDAARAQLLRIALPDECQLFWVNSHTDRIRGYRDFLRFGLPGASNSAKCGRPLRFHLRPQLAGQRCARCAISPSSPAARGHSLRRAV